MRELFLYLIPVVIGAIVLRFWGKSRQTKRTELLNETAQKSGWTDVSHEASALLQTLHDFRLFRRGTRTNVTNVLKINEQDRVLMLKHGSMTNNVTYSYIVLFRKLKSQQHPQFNIGLKQHNRVRTVPENHTVIQSEQLGMLKGRHDVESRTSDTSHVLNLLTPHVVSTFEAIHVGEKYPEMEVREQHLLIYRPQISGESSETIEQFVQRAHDFSQGAGLI